jgi:hypothetical protein
MQLGQTQAEMLAAQTAGMDTSGIDTGSVPSAGTNTGFFDTLANFGQSLAQAAVPIYQAYTQAQQTQAQTQAQVQIAQAQAQSPYAYLRYPTAGVPPIVGGVPQIPAQQTSSILPILLIGGAVLIGGYLILK